MKAEESVKRLYLLRHAKSSWRDPSLEDFDRALNGRGRRAARTMGEYMRRRGMRPALVLCSAAMRATQTLELVQAALGGDLPAQIDDGLYLAEPGALLSRIQRVDDSLLSVMLIGHNPGIERLAVALSGSGDDEARQRMQAKFPTAALAVLAGDQARWRDLRQGGARLEAFIRPKDLA